MPFNFEASGPGDSVDWGLYSFTQRIEKTDEELDQVQIAKQHRAYYPQETCARRASNIHISLIERLYGQMQNGQTPNAFAETTYGLDFSTKGRYDGDAVFKVKDFTPEFVQEYYPSLFAIIREFEGCMIDIMDQGCMDGPDSCRILDFRWMGYLPDGNQFAYVEKIPNFPSLGDEETATQDCEQTTGFGDCADGGAFASDSDSYAGFGADINEQVPQTEQSSQIDQENERSSADTDANVSRLTPQGYIKDVLINEALGEHPVLDVAILGLADYFGVDLNAQETLEAVSGLQSEALKGIRDNIPSAARSPELDLLIEIIE